jgi:hypothetical protein
LKEPKPPKAPLTPYEIVIASLYGIPLELLLAAKEELRPDHIQRDNYQQWVVQYGVQGIEPPPALLKTAENDWKTAGQPNGTCIFEQDKWKVKIPDGYQASTVSIQVMGHVFAEWTIGASIYSSDPVLGPSESFNIQALINENSTKAHLSYRQPHTYDVKQLEGEQRIGELPFAIRGYTYDGITAIASILCECSNEEFTKWQEKDV